MAAKQTAQPQPPPPTPEEPPVANAPLERALAARAALREALVANNELVATLKRQKRQTRIVASTLESLKQLQRISA